MEINTTKIKIHLGKAACLEHANICINFLNSERF